MSVFIASAVMAITFLVHVFAGGPDLYTPLRTSPLSSVEIATFSVVWHFTSLQLFLFAAALYYLSRHHSLPLFSFLLASNIGFAALFIGYGIVDFGSVWSLPQWIAFALTTVLMMSGRRAK